MAEERQCRICYDGVEAEPELGRLIRPCLCKGSVSDVHIKCLQRWRNTSVSQGAFFSCPQCHYKYRFARTRFVGIATNPVIVGAISALLFALLTLLSSAITTYFISSFDSPTSLSYSSYYSSWNPFYVSPIELAHDLIRAALRILQDGDLASILDDTLASNRTPRTSAAPGPGTTSTTNLPTPRSSAGLKSLLTRFLLGLPLIGAGSLVHMLLSVPFLAPLQWLARARGTRRRNNDAARDVAALVVVVLIVVGAARALYKVYQVTQAMTKRVLLRAEDAILEVN